MIGKKVIPDPANYPGMVGVSRDAFFSTLGRLDVSPSCHGYRHDEVLGYRSDWKTPYGRVLGMTIGGTHASESAYMVTREFYEANRAALTSSGS